MYATLKESFAKHAEIDVILDRRQAQRRRQTLPPEVDRRMRERRSFNIDALLRRLRWVVDQTDSGARKENGEAAAFSFARLRGYATPVGLRDTLYDRQAQASAAPISVRLSVGIEDSGQRLGGNAHARVLDPVLELRARVGELYEHAAATRR
jgi:hypothetical protein